MAQGSARENSNNATETTLALIKAKTDNIPPLGQAPDVGSVPVVLTVAQLAALTPGAPITGFSLEATQLAIGALISAINTKTPTSPAQETGNLGSIKTNTDKLDILLSALRDAIRGAGPKDFTTLDALIAARLGTLGQKPMATSAPVVIASDQSPIPITTAGSNPTFLAYYDAVVPAANKYMATLFNANAARKLVIQKIYASNQQIAAVAGALSVQELRRITARTAGTLITPSSYDTADALSGSITADHASTGVTDSDLLFKFIRAFDEVQTSGGGSYSLETLAAVQPLSLIYEKKDDTRGIVIRNGQGLTIKNITAVAVGSMSYGILFTDEAA